VSGTDALRMLGPIDDSDPDALYTRLMSFLFGGLRAPLPEIQSKPVRKPRAKRAA
jgi:hypothetical protein